MFVPKMLLPEFSPNLISILGMLFAGGGSQDFLNSDTACKRFVHDADL